MSNHARRHRHSMFDSSRPVEGRVQELIVWMCDDPTCPDYGIHHLPNQARQHREVRNEERPGAVTPGRSANPSVPTGGTQHANRNR